MSETHADEPTYFDVDGNRVDLATLCRREPLWAMNRIKHMGQVMSALVRQLNEEKAASETVRLAATAETKRMAEELERTKQVLWPDSGAALEATLPEIAAEIRGQLERATKSELEWRAEFARVCARNARLNVVLQDLVNAVQSHAESLGGAPGRFDDIESQRVILEKADELLKEETRVL